MICAPWVLSEYKSFSFFIGLIFQSAEHMVILRAHCHQYQFWHGLVQECFLVYDACNEMKVALRNHHLKCSLLAEIVVAVIRILVTNYQMPVIQHVMPQDKSAQLSFWESRIVCGSANQHPQVIPIYMGGAQVSPCFNHAHESRSLSAQINQHALICDDLRFFPLS